MTILKLEGITQRFGGLVALDNVTLTVRADGIGAIIGPNGAGKTTLFNVITGFQKPNAGRVDFDGKDITGMAPNAIASAGIVRTFQLVQIFSEVSALRNVVIGHHQRTRGGLWTALARPPWSIQQANETRDRSADLLEFVGLGGRADIPAGALTYGEKRLLEIARALATGPRLLLLDEPAAGLNPVETGHLAQTVRRIVERGITVLLIEHDMKFVMQLAERVFVLDFGRVIAEGTPQEVQTNSAVVEAYLGSVETSNA